MEPPELYVRQNPTPNAYTLAISGRKPFIVVHTSLLELLTPPELQAVLAHGKQQQQRWQHVYVWREIFVCFRAGLDGRTAACMQANCPAVKV